MYRHQEEYPRNIVLKYQNVKRSFSVSTFSVSTFSVLKGRNEAIKIKTTFTRLRVRQLSRTMN